MLLQDKRIFITEDNLTNRAIMQLLLEQEGAIVSFERWGIDTYSRIRAFTPIDIVLLDLMFPNNISGFDVFDQIREMPELQGVPIVAVSAMPADSAIPETRAKGFHGFISKPIDYKIFALQVSSVLDGAAIWYSR
jgi:two-component system cell cycle response regulator DivK